MDNRLTEQLDNLLYQIQCITLSTKKIMTVADLCMYTGFSKSYIYKLTSERVIPHYKPMGKAMFFNRTEIDGWLLSNRVEPIDKLLEGALINCKH